MVWRLRDACVPARTTVAPMSPINGPDENYHEADPETGEHQLQHPSVQRPFDGVGARGWGWLRSHCWLPGLLRYRPPPAMAEGSPT